MVGIQMMHKLAIVAWFVAPWPAVRLGGGRIGTFLFIALAVMALAVASQRHSFRLNPRSQRIVLLTTLVALGLALGEIASGSGPEAIVRVAGFWLGAVAPVFVVNALSNRDRAVKQLALAFLAGTLASLAVATLPGSLPLLEAKSGFAGHKNQLAATLVISLPLLVFVTTRTRGGTATLRLALGGLILWGLNETVSRSGLLAVTVIAVLAITFIEPRRRRLMHLLVAASTLLAVAALAGGAFGGLVDELTNSGALARATGATNTTASDAARVELLNAGFDALDGRTIALGQGFTLDRQPHNVFLGTWVAGGLLAVGGLLTLALMPLRAFLRDARDTSRESFDGIALSLSVLGYFVVAFFNVLLWVPYAWASIALFAVSEPTRRTADPAAIRARSNEKHALR